MIFCCACGTLLIVQGVGINAECIIIKQKFYPMGFLLIQES